MNKIKKITFNDYLKYKFKQIKNMNKSILATVLHFTLRLFGFWYCEHCDTFHSPLTIKYEFNWNPAYSIHKPSSYMCSIAKDSFIQMANSKGLMIGAGNFIQLNFEI